MSKKPTVLMILDGYGLNESEKGNAVAEAKTPGDGPADEGVSFCKRQRQRDGGRTSGRTDGKL